MTREILLLQLGMGGVGRVLVQQVLAQRVALADRYNLSLSYLALVDTSAVLATGDPLSAALITSALQAKQQGQPLASLDDGRPGINWLAMLPDTPCIVVDTTSADGMEAHLQTVLTDGHRVVLANKKPLTGSISAFAALTRRGTTRYEATVGAGLPILATLQSLLDTGDSVTRIEASLSGTLGYLCTALQEATPLSEAVRTARSRGWTEPDPRDDLSGMDVARKALILARTCGLEWEMQHVPATAWFPAERATLSVDAFMEHLPELDAEYAARCAHASVAGNVLRYVATLELGDEPAAAIALRELPADHPLAALRGTDNLFVFTTRRYSTPPLMVRGPGAGTEVTAAGVLADIIATAREM
ncbi:MAG: homoserine dehydrogenase [Chloroflexaceae bacterium]|nr:homoserine dehydrogenase [Chloroflexaceae bacterium]NJO05709.1 homoserine dehydrogenase [Chloroflexaceae bacterium]